MEPKAQSPGNNESLQEQCVGLEGKGQCSGSWGVRGLLRTDQRDLSSLSITPTRGCPASQNNLCY